MRIHDLLDQVYETFRENTDGIRTILLHPRSRYRSVLVARILNAPDLNVFYYALGPDDINIQSFLAGITHDLANQHPMFGRHIHMLPAEDAENFDILLTTFARDLAELSSERFYLILDEYDRSDSADDVQRFIEHLIMHLPEHCQVIINSRNLPRLPWVSMIAQRRAILLEDNQIIRHDFYDVTKEGENNLEVFALGPGFVLLNGKPIDTWEGHLPRLLFFFALDRPVITRSEICQAFWPDLDTDQAVNVFHVTKRRLHKAFEMDVLVHEEGYYRINPELGVQYDVMDFVAHLMEGRNRDNTSRMEDWQRAINLYRGPFLQGHNDDWITSRRSDFQSGYLEALTETARYRLSEGHREHALGLFQRAITEDGTRQEIHGEIMRLYTDLGRRSEAAAHYQKVIEDLRRAQREPSPELQSLYHEIMA
jgi:DNA-binding SARP family transcriptional activator